MSESTPKIEDDRLGGVRGLREEAVPVRGHLP